MSDSTTDDVLTKPETLERIAWDELEISTLEFRDDPEQDFHRPGVWEIETVLDRAYEAGHDAGYLAGQKAASEWRNILAKIEAGCEGSAS